MAQLRDTPGLRVDGPRRDGEEKINTIMMVLIFRSESHLPPPQLEGVLSLLTGVVTPIPAPCLLCPEPHQVEAVLPAAHFLHQHSKKVSP